MLRQALGNHRCLGCVPSRRGRFGDHSAQGSGATGQLCGLALERSLSETCLGPKYVTNTPRSLAMSVISSWEGEVRVGQVTSVQLCSF